MATWFALSPNRYIWDHGNLHMQLELPIWISEKFETKWCEKLETVIWIRMLVSEWGNHAEEPVFCLLWLCNYPPSLSALKTECFFTWLWDLTGPSWAVPPLTFLHGCLQAEGAHSFTCLVPRLGRLEHLGILWCFSLSPFGLSTWSFPLGGFRVSGCLTW